MVGILEKLCGGGRKKRHHSQVVNISQGAREVEPAEPVTAVVLCVCPLVGGTKERI